MSKPDVEVMPNDPHFIMRDGGWFRAGAQGYTTRISEAGVFSGEVAQAYRRECSGISIRPLADMQTALAFEVKRMRKALVKAEALLTSLATPALIAAEDRHG